MLLARGFFDKSGNPCLKFQMAGVHQSPPGLEFQAIIDTGFTGFISLPIAHAFTLGLPLHGTATSILADGSRSTSITALGTVTFGKQLETGVVVLEAQSQEILIGMDFLRTFKLSLLMTKDDIWLLEEDWPEKLKTKQQGLPEFANVVVTKPAAAQEAKAAPAPQTVKPSSDLGKPPAPAEPA